MNAMFEGYSSTGPAYDEMFEGDALRPPYQRLRETLATLTQPELVTRVEALQAGYLDQGVTFDIGGEERAFPLDILPRVIEQDTWATLDAGVQQRVRALELFLADVYDAGRVFDDGVIPRRVITTSSHYHRAAAGVRPANGVRVHVSGIDLVRDNAGEFRVLEDNVRVPSGVSYVMTNRRAISSALPETTAAHRIRPVAAYPQRLLAALRAAAPAGVADPTVVVLTPGVYNGAYFEHALLARTMGVELVEGRDLECRRGRVMMRTTQGLAPVHVIYRRIDDDFLDPVHFRADSVLGCPGLIDAARAGNVTLANAVGNGVADDKLVYTYLPDIIRYYLAEEPVIQNVDTWRVGDADAREEVLDRLDELVLKPVDGSGGKGIVIGPRATRAELDELRAKVLESPRDWIAQPVVQLSTVPTFVEGSLGPRHVDLRPFAVNDGSRVWVLPGGLTRVALAEGELIVNSSRGGGSKDTWVLAGPAVSPARPDPVAPEPEPEPAPPPQPVPETRGPALGTVHDVRHEQAEQQQQQGPSPRWSRRADQARLETTGPQPARGLETGAGAPSSTTVGSSHHGDLPC
ncbi:circularly permuted type 2 ATP-grasp protein [Nocardioides litoris]|uniref:circularly permuted type 2 ATP-grasp protein n=1 Tax=Nocardioides litoris TaxID=1926648 RepID=UPI00111EA89E|nr:circularly permuted type 2 ATP-grasp protein [Nocardioides litoris]